MEISDECISCLENNKVIYLLPCLHKICSECLSDIDKHTEKNSKYKCIQCHEQFDFDIIKTKNFKNEIFDNDNDNDIKDNKISDEEIIINENFISELIITISKIIDNLNFVLKDFVRFKDFIEENYDKNSNKINNLSFYYDELIIDLINENNSLQKSDLKTIDLEIDNIKFLLEQYDKYLLMVKSIDCHINHDKITKFISYTKTPITLALEYLNLENFIKKELVNNMYFDLESNEFMPKSEKYIIDDYNDFINMPNTVTHIVLCDPYLISLFSQITNNSVTHFTLIGCYNQNITKDCIPKSVTHLSIGLYTGINDINREITYEIPNSVRNLTFENSFDQCINNCIPNSVTLLRFGYHFNRDIKNYIPNSVTHLEFGHKFNQDIRDCIPDSVTHLTLDCEFNQDLDVIPNSVTHLTIRFNRMIKDCIPSNVTHLKFGSCFDQNIKGCIPNTVTHLIFCDDFNQNIKGCIPNSVTHLEFGNRFNQNIKGCIPNSVTHLKFGPCFDQNIKHCIPNSVTHLTFGRDFDKNLKDTFFMSLYEDFKNFIYHSNINYNNNKIRTNKETISYIPNSVTHLTFGYYFNQNIKGCIPNSVTHLTFGWRFNQDIKDCIPDSVIYLKIPGNRNIDLSDIPKTVKKLQIID
jgi:hypothetical protein